MPRCPGTGEASDGFSPSILLTCTHQWIGTIEVHGHLYYSCAEGKMKGYPKFIPSTRKTMEGLKSGSTRLYLFPSSSLSWVLMEEDL